MTYWFVHVNPDSVESDIDGSEVENLLDPPIAGSIEDKVRIDDFVVGPAIAEHNVRASLGLIGRETRREFDVDVVGETVRVGLVGGIAQQRRIKNGHNVHTLQRKKKITYNLLMVQFLILISYN